MSRQPVSVGVGGGGAPGKSSASGWTRDQDSGPISPTRSRQSFPSGVYRRDTQETAEPGDVGGSSLLVVAVVSRVLSWATAPRLPVTSGTPRAQQTPAPSGAPSTVPVDSTKVAALMKKISANPKDTASLLALGDIYFAAADYKNASLWEQKVLGVDPKNQAALLAVGAAQFNLGNTAEAKKQWLVAAGLYPKNAEVHYDLGFLYLSQTPPDKVNMTAEWNKVIAIDPTSDLAKSVASHLKAPTPTPSAK